MLRVQLHSLQNANAKQRQLAQQAIVVLKAICRDERFLPLVRTTEYSKRWRKTDAGKNEQATNEQIVEIVATGKEFRQPVDDEIDLSVKLARLGSGTVVGYVSPPNPLITTNTRFYDRWVASNDYLSPAAHWMHEWMHVASFYHKGETTSDVAYSLGRIVVGLGKSLVVAGKVHLPDDYYLGFGYLESMAQSSCPVTGERFPSSRKKS